MSTNPYDALSSQDKPPVKSRVGVALVCLHISAFLYVLLGVALGVVLALADASNESEFNVSTAIGGGACGFIVCAMIAVGVESVAYGIRKRRFWGWVAGLIVFAMYVPS